MKLRNFILQWKKKCGHHMGVLIAAIRSTLNMQYTVFYKLKQNPEYAMFLKPNKALT
jgi:Ni,Fe-hydrogenase III component G